MAKRILVVLGMLCGLNLAGAANATEFYPDNTAEGLYPVPQFFNGSKSPSQFDYNNSFLSVRNFEVLPNGGTAVLDGKVRANDLVSGSPAFTALDQRLTSISSQLQLTSIQLQQLQQIQTAFTQYALQAQETALRAQRGVAAVAAMSNIWMPSAPGRTAWAVNGSTFQGEFGGGISVAHRLNLNIPLAITAAYGNGAGSAHVARVGLMGEF